MTISCFVYLITLGVAIKLAVAAYCEVNPLQNRNSPLIIPHGGTTFLYPYHGHSQLRIASDETVDLLCPGGSLVAPGSSTESLLQATCISGTSLEILTTTTSWANLYCSGDTTAISRPTGHSCEGGGMEAEIGFSLTDQRFLRIIRVCFDTSGQTSLYAHFTLTASIGNRALKVPSPLRFGEDGFYSVGINTLDQLYERKTHRRTVNTLVGLGTSDTKYVVNVGDFYLSRGHLAAKASFYHASQQIATYRYINTAPQWQNFNGGNWNEIEISVRRYADRHRVNLEIWTGTYGTATLPHESTDTQVPLYLYTDNENRAVPVPEIFWKVVYDPVSGRGVALIGVNNPYNTALTTICTDVSSGLNWLSWDRTNVAMGYSYACSVADLRSSVSYVPNLPVTGLLV